MGPVSLPVTYAFHILASGYTALGSMPAQIKYTQICSVARQYTSLKSYYKSLQKRSRFAPGIIWETSFHLNGEKHV